MDMSFFWRIKFTLLFPSWVPDSPVHYAFMLMLTAGLGALHEWIAHKHWMILTAYSTPGPIMVKDPQRDYPKQHEDAILIAVLMHAAYVTTSYLLMMMAMSFNAGIFIAITVGLCIGFYAIWPLESSNRARIVPGPASC
ncbi:hypothetical protein SELMODRAFT_413719 [Selaginella moellendorffii]|uniref:Copper transport protein n=1 Tax=Selaginella moellendorffii TaxID=88036 RepID=D8RQ03_SELML|nr:copper transporter 5 [Selaginella moellendorffii]EFJ25771.1 hypothetical protein SELMODRAFT_413719 [Selaginella moellendorffii]|eukprot:XP_002973397.1 copper transporter 5 [Selaginella moellendorffii]